MSILFFLLSLFHHSPRPVWQGNYPSCPAHWTVYADESRAIAGKDAAICVKE